MCVAIWTGVTNDQLNRKETFLKNYQGRVILIPIYPPANAVRAGGEKNLLDS
jgi:hypothetical protein